MVPWLIASGLFALYVAHFGSYNRVYGSLAAVIIFLIWMWISNTAVLIGAEFNAELERGRAIADGLPPDQEPFTELRDTRKLPEKQKTGRSASGGREPGAGDGRGQAGDDADPQGRSDAGDGLGCGHHGEPVGDGEGDVKLSGALLPARDPVMRPMRSARQHTQHYSDRAEKYRNTI